LRYPPAKEDATMKRFLCVVGLAAALSLTWGGSAFATDQDTFNKLIAKVAPTVNSLATNFKPKLACACVSNLLPGVVALDSLGEINCELPGFAPDGSFGGFLVCNGDFVVLH
jgi:hypothetical protein